MGDVRIQSSSGPISAETNVEETPSATSLVKDNQTEPQQSTGTFAALKEQGKEVIGQMNMRELILRQGLNNQFQSAPNTTFNTPAPGGPQKQAPAGAATKGGPVTYEDRNREQAVRGMQTSLNRWREANHQPKIDVNGTIDSKTTDAIKEFQKAGGLPETGVMNGSTRDRLTLLTEIKSRTAKHKNASDNVDHLLVSAGFKNLPEKMQTELLTNVKQYARGDLLTRDRIGTLADILHQSPFTALTPASRKAVLDDFFANPERRSLELITNAINDPIFGGLSPALQREALEALRSHPQEGFSDQTNNVTQLLNTTAFQNLDPGLRKQVLGGLYARFDGAQLDPVTIMNMMTVASEPRFGALRPEVREELLSAQSRKPFSTRLASELQQLAADPFFKVDRNWQKKIEDAERFTP